MADEPTAGEVNRALAVFRDQVREDFAGVRGDLNSFRKDFAEHLDRMVPTSVYIADRKADQLRHDQLMHEIADLREARQQDRAAVDKASAARAANRKIVIISVIIPIGLAIAEIVFTVRGGH